MKKMMVWFQTALRPVKNEKGTIAMEYGLFAALITVGIIASLKIIGPVVSKAFADVATALSTS